MDLSACFIITLGNFTLTSSCSFHLRWYSFFHCTNSASGSSSFQEYGTVEPKLFLLCLAADLFWAAMHLLWSVSYDKDLLLLAKELVKFPVLRLSKISFRFCLMPFTVRLSHSSLAHSLQMRFLRRNLNNRNLL